MQSVDFADGDSIVGIKAEWVFSKLEGFSDY